MTVSVVIPTKDRRERVLRTVRSALGQEEAEVEVLVVDDGSSDGTADAIDSLADARVRVLRNERSLGPAGARNRAIEEAEGEWVAFLDDDDLWSPGKTRAQLDAAEEVGAGYVYGTALVVDDALRVIEIYEGPEPSELPCLLIRGNAVPAGASNVMARTELVRRIGGFDERLSLLADWDLWLRLAAESPGAVCRDPVIAYVHHGTNIVLEGGADKYREMEYLADKHAALEGRCGIEFDVVGLVHWIADGQAAAGRRLKALRTRLAGAIRYRNPGLVSTAARGLRARPQHSPPTAVVAPPAWLAALRG